jgi:hypothetical protein
VEYDAVVPQFKLWESGWVMPGKSRFFKGLVVVLQVKIKAGESRLRFSRIYPYREGTNLKGVASNLPGKYSFRQIYIPKRKAFRIT